MSTITASDVKKLRDMTGAGMMDCKKALSEAAGDFDEAVAILRKKGQKLSAKRAGREAKEGVVLAKVTGDKTKGVIVKLSCETDFVAKTDSFIGLAEKIADIALKNFPATLEDLLNLPFDDELTVAEKITEQVGVIGEKVELAEYATLEAPMVAPYIHMGNKAGVLVGLSIADEAYFEPGRGVAMQVAAMRPIAVSEEGVDSKIVEKEIEIGMEQARQQGKPEQMLEKIAQGKLKKFLKENTLLNQEFVRGEGKQTVGAYLKGLHDDLTVTDFKHVELG